MTEQRRALESTSGPVLVVDDDPTVRSLFARALRDAGYDTLEAVDGVEALALIERQPVGLVVLDSAMPRLDGAGVIRAVREHEATRTLPVLLITGAGDENSLISGLGSGADDFMAKPVRLDELVARVGAHLRSRAAWSRAVEEELSSRSAVVAAIGRLPISAVPEEVAEAVVAELARQTEYDLIVVSQLVSNDRLRDLATYSRVGGVRRGGGLLPPDRSSDLVARARQGPWVDDVRPLDNDFRAAAFAATDLRIGASAPIYAGNELVGLLALVIGEGKWHAPTRRASLLAATIDFANILSAVAGSALGERRDSLDLRARLEEVLAARAFRPVFQPIVDLGSRNVVGYEALTRFADGTRPDVRFAEAHSVGLGHEYELGAIDAALAAAAPNLPGDVFVSLNVSPSLLLERRRRLRAMIRSVSRQLVLEITEHVPIEEYAALGKAIDTLDGVRLAVDDAGAGYASLRHILELRPTFVKLDISLVRGIETDKLRQALVAGLDHFALRSGSHLIAEGVETEDEAATLEGLGIEFAQGYLFGRPEPITD